MNNPPPIEGMKEIPYGLPLMGPAWAACVSWAITIPEMRRQFERDTGFNLDTLSLGSPIDQLIDEATGWRRKCFNAWCDWVTVNVWGREEA